MEVASKKTFLENSRELFLKTPHPFTNKRDIHWRVIFTCAGICIGIFILAVLLIPAPTPEMIAFQEKKESGQKPFLDDSQYNATEDTLTQLQQSKTRFSRGSYDYLSGNPSPSNGTRSSNKNSSMIISRNGADAKNSLPAGTKMKIYLIDKIIADNQSMPIIGIVKEDVIYENIVAISQDTKFFGMASFSGENDRAQINWNIIRFPDGKERQISAIGVGKDGAIGIDGDIKSNGIKNSIGNVVSRFIEAYADGSGSRGQLGASDGGHLNGLKNAVAQTAKDKADYWAEEMQKERKWIELPAGMEVNTVLNQSFRFRDPGATYGQ